MKHKHNIKHLTANSGFSLDDVLEITEKVFNSLDISKETKQDYLYRMPRFINFISENGFSSDIYLDYKKALLQDNTLGISSKNKYLITAKVFLKELNRKGIVQQDITQNIKGFKQGSKHKKQGINSNEMQSILDHLNTLGNSKENIRLKMIVSFLALQGLRQIELVRLDVEHLDLNNKIALIQGKGCVDTETIHLQPEVVRHLKEYIKEFNIKSGCLLVSTSNRNKGSRITTRALRGLVKELLNELRIEKSTHSFRHYFTTKLIDSYNGDLLQVRKYTRHKGIEMLQVYNDSVLTERDLPRFYEVFSSIKFI